MKNKKTNFALFLLMILFSLLMGCSPQTIPQEGATKEAILAYSEAKTDGLLAGLSGDDYAMFSKDFDAEMSKALSEPAFDKLKKDRDAKLGAYVSRQVNSVIQSGDFYAVIYDVVFEKDAAVKMRVVFRITEPHQISGLWFDK